MEGNNSWHVFICHASEDKESFVEPLVKKLEAKGLKVWYDDITIKVGDSLREAIDNGIAHSKFGLIVLSSAFFKKEWTRKELNALFTKQLLKRGSLLPIWYKVDQADVFNFSPLVSDLHALKFRDSEIDKENFKKLYEAIAEHSYITQPELDTIIRNYLDADKKEIHRLRGELDYRVMSYFNCCNEYVAKMIGGDEIKEEDIEVKENEIFRKYGMPPGVYTSFESRITQSTIQYFKSRLHKWIEGKMEVKECCELVGILDEGHDFDFIYLYFGLPNAASPRATYLGEILTAIVHIGTRKTTQKLPMPEEMQMMSFQGYLNSIL